MADDSKIIEIDLALLQTNGKAATSTLKGLNRVLESVAEGVREAFTVKGFEDYKQTVTRFGKALSDELLTLQLSFGRMKIAIADAVAPLASVFVPMLNSAVQAVIHFSGVVGQFLRGIISGITGNQNLAASAEEATHSEEKLSSAAKSAGKAVKRSLAGFDQLERLSGRSGSGGSSGSSGLDIWGGFKADPISPQVQAVVDKVLALIEPLRNIDLQPLKLALDNLGLAFSSLASLAGEAMNFLWFEVLTPFAAWIMEVLAPVLTNYWASALEMVTAALQPVMAGVKLLWEALKPVVAYIGEAVVTAIGNWRYQFEILAATFREKHPVIVGIFQNISQLVTQVWSVVSPVLTNLGDHFSSVFQGVSRTVGTVVGYILDMLYGLTTFLSGAFSGSWKTAWSGVVSFLKSAVNGVITLLNNMISRLVSALNSVVYAANKLSFTVPSWVPILGGKRFGVNLPYVYGSSIPYLAKGAVLPANQPFLAMVGDQRHGTNVEAPLSTIQEAVALVMEDQTGAILRGFEASVSVQQEILEAVLGIRIGDDLIGQAVERYQQKMAIVRGW